MNSALRKAIKTLETFALHSRNDAYYFCGKENRHQLLGAGKSREAKISADIFFSTHELYANRRVLIPFPFSPLCVLSIR